MKLTQTMLGLAALSAVAAAPAGAADPAAANLHFAVLRNGSPIGTMTTIVRRDGKGVVAETATHIRVKIAYVSVYRFDQTETEHWADGQFVDMSAKTNDNGTVHEVTATADRDAIKIVTDGNATEADRSAIPASLWNPALLKKATALNANDGSIMKLHVVDRGDEQLDLDGRTVKTHHYSIDSSFSQDVWYDANNQLVKVELRGSDGSKIEYEPN
ncbi:MAG TPA: DUF6134 family protein [Stellaceae bacterium]|jgi:hypothetical protein|nr:DUF6134 family protein [Stellaceae bacterium]